MLQREPVNIEGHKNGSAVMSRQSYFNTFLENPVEAPPPVGVYARSRMVYENQNMDVGMLHIPGLAFDVKEQVHYRKYVQENGDLKPDALEGIRNEYADIAEMVVQGYLTHSKQFGAKKSERLLIGAYGANNFVKALKASDQAAVRKLIAETLVDALERNAKQLKEAGAKDVRLGILLTGLLDVNTAKGLESRLNKVELQRLDDWGYIPNDVQSGDYIVNAWDPNSNVGNGNAMDNSLDGYIGRSSTAAYDIHTSSRLDDLNAYVPIKRQEGSAWLAEFKKKTEEQRQSDINLLKANMKSLALGKQFFNSKFHISTGNKSGAFFIQTREYFQSEGTSKSRNSLSVSIKDESLEINGVAIDKIDDPVLLDRATQLVNEGKVAQKLNARDDIPDHRNKEVLTDGKNYLAYVEIGSEGKKEKIIFLQDKEAWNSAGAQGRSISFNTKTGEVWINGKLKEIGPSDLAWIESLKLSDQSVFKKETVTTGRTTQHGLSAESEMKRWQKHLETHPPVDSSGIEIPTYFSGNDEVFYREKLLPFTARDEVKISREGDNIKFSSVNEDDYATFQTAFQKFEMNNNLKFENSEFVIPIKEYFTLIGKFRSREAFWSRMNGGL